MARVAVVTGGTRGIGEAISLALKDQGRTVIDQNVPSKLTPIRGAFGIHDRA